MVHEWGITQPVQHNKTIFKYKKRDRDRDIVLRFVTINLKYGFLNFFEIGLNNEKNYFMVFISY